MCRKRVPNAAEHILFVSFWDISSADDRQICFGLKCLDPVPQGLHGESFRVVCLSCSSTSSHRHGSVLEMTA